MNKRPVFALAGLILIVSSSCNFLAKSRPAAIPTETEVTGSSTTGPTLPPAATSLPAIGPDNLDQLEQAHAYGHVLSALFGSSFDVMLSTFPVAYSPDGHYVALGGCTSFFRGGESGRPRCGNDEDSSDDETAKSFMLILDASTEEIIARLPDNEPDSTFTDAAFTHNGSRLYLSVHHPKRPSELMIWDMTTQRIESVLWNGLGYPGIDISPDGRWLALDNGLAEESTGKVEIFDLTNDTVLTELPGGYWAPQFSADGRKLAVAPHDRFSIYDTGNWTMTASIRLPCERCFTAISPDLAVLATVDAGQQVAPILIWDIATGQQLQSLSAGENDLSYLYFTPDGRMLWDLMHGQTAAVWDVATWQPIGSQDFLEPILNVIDEGIIRSIQFADDGHTFLLQTGWDIYLASLPK